MMTPEGLEGQFTLLTAAARYDALRIREALADDADIPPLGAEEALELLALGEVIARKAGYGRQLTVRTARAAGASWSQIGAALGMSKQAAWEAHSRWIDDQAEQHRRGGYEGLTGEQAASARAPAGQPDRPPAHGALGADGADGAGES
ncbi:MAG TPA: hypothetical protein VFU43_06645 [Streptosporangiaceae bacterium]|nr:hypothetical protein [Streptosporangiaceae bacterium]